MAASPAPLARCATSAGGYSPSDAEEWQWRSTRAVGTLGRSPGRLGRAEQVQKLVVGQLGERSVRTAAPDRCVAGEAALALGPGAVLEHEPEHQLLDLFRDRKSTRLNSSHGSISYAVFCLKK